MNRGWRDKLIEYLLQPSVTFNQYSDGYKTAHAGERVSALSNTLTSNAHTIRDYAYGFFDGHQ